MNGSKRALMWVFALVFMGACLCGCPASGQNDKCGPPAVDAGADLAGRVGEEVVMRASVHLPPEDLQLCVDEKSKITFRWEQIGGTDVVLNGANQPQASFLPQEAGSYTFRCQATYPVTVNNPEAQVSQWDTIKVEVEAAACPPPVASAGGDQVVSTPAGQSRTVALDGSSSRPGEGPGCEGINIASATWSQVSGPQVTIQNADQLTASVELSQFDTYVFQLRVQDSGGTEGGRVDNASDTVSVTLVESSPCENSLVVTVIDAATSAPLSGVHVKVVDAGGAHHDTDTGADGKAQFSSLADGTRRSISAVSDEMVPALPLAPAGQRRKYEITTVLEHCSGTITLPLRRTTSGQAAGQFGTVSGKIPQNVWDMLPHSFRCSNSCSTDGDCEPSFYCEHEANVCQGLCTPRSLLPFFSLGGGEISGQLRVAILTPLYSHESFTRFPVASLFAEPPSAGAILPGNLSSDDIFLNGLASSLGLDPFGGQCDSIADCPNSTDWTCDYDTGRCKDKHPLRNFRLKVAAGGSSPLVLMIGVIDVSMLDLLPILLPFLEGSGEEVDFDVPSFMAAFKMTTLSVCPVKVNVTAGQDNNISSALAALTASDCWNVRYQQRDDVAPVPDSTAVDPGNTCDPQDDQCQNVRPDLKCLASPWNPTDYYCFVPLYKVTIISSDRVSMTTQAGGFDPFTTTADARVCGLLPATDQHEVKCDADGNGVPERCDPPVFCDVTVNQGDTDCAFTFGLALASLDFAPGHQVFGSGGRAIIGFDYNRTPYLAYAGSSFLVPPRSGTLDGARVSVAQQVLRNLVYLSDQSYQMLPGRLGSTASSSSASLTSLEIPFFPPPPATGSTPEAGINVRVYFVPDDSLAPCNEVTFEKQYAMARGFPAPTAQQTLSGVPTESVQRDLSLHGLVLARIDRVGATEKKDTVVDNWWRVYAPAGLADFQLPDDLVPFASGNEVLLTFWGSRFGAAFDYNLFTAQQVLSGEVGEAEDGWFLMIP